MTDETNRRTKIDWVTFAISGGFLVLFLIMSVFNKSLMGEWITSSFDFSVKFFGAFWQVLLLATFIVGIALALSKYGKVNLGKLNKPEYSLFRWVSMILCTLLAAGGVFWAAGEPMYHYLTTPPLLDEQGMSKADAVIPGLAQSFFHWGFTAWASLGTVATIVLMYAHYHKGYPLKPRTILYPMFGEKIFNRKSVIGSVADIVSIIAVAAGTIGPIGFLGLQVGYALEYLFGVPDTILTESIVIIFLVAIASISAASGVDKGIQLMSRLNVGLAVVLMFGMLILGPTLFIIDSFIGAEAYQIQNFVRMSLYRGDQSWLGYWTIFFWGWFIGFGPAMAMFISRISRGRSIRELILAVAIIAPLVSNFWFASVGGSGIFFEMKNPGAISTALNDSGMPAAVMAIMEQLPLGMVMATGFLVVTIIFVATTADSMSYSVAVTLTGDAHPSRWLRIFWALLFGFIAASLLSIGESSIQTLQNFIVVTAVPVSILLLPPVWGAPKVAKLMAIEQGIVKDTKATSEEEETQPEAKSV
ncbi:BCCT transporter [Pontibacillus halophilus JSM 076056 = DSM 19796]|uniref:BCCT transporter n=1 Tax=Pontibacillus halophilus JSM 076056 = DSM 19796 TaxID=1385510 RepID=A0A0A5HW63_9BACI|nr:BCCT family transporter [Pontibacillus halophilus]KGX87877.1 BCCT transporter [Pontibacillus halophilus JSM 076056 = DSM 19796]